MKIQKFEDWNMGAMRVEVERRLKELEEFGLMFKVGRITYTGKKYSCKVKCYIAENDEEIRHIEWDENCHRYGLLPSHYLTPFVLDGKRYQMWNIKKENKTYPIIVRNLDNGKDYKIPVADLRRAVITGELT